MRDILNASLEHAVIVFTAVLVAVAIGVPLGVLLTRREKLRGWVMGIANILQTIPSLALFGFLLPLPLIGGVGKRTAIIALILYALLPILRNMLVGIFSIDPGVRESAKAMGMTQGQVLRDVELPLAFPTILAGIRTATVATIGTATIAAAIGGGGLGTFVFRGIAMVDTNTILAGAIPAAIMAIAADEVLGWIEKRASWSR